MGNNRNPKIKPAVKKQFALHFKNTLTSGNSGTQLVSIDRFCQEIVSTSVETQSHIIFLAL